MDKPIITRRNDVKNFGGKFQNQQSFKKHIFEKRKGVCQGCGHQFKITHFVLDHKFPISLGGKQYEESNVQLLCKNKCNKDKTIIDLSIINFCKRIGLINKCAFEWRLYVPVSFLKEFYDYCFKIHLMAKPIKERDEEW